MKKLFIILTVLMMVGMASPSHAAGNWFSKWNIFDWVRDVMGDGSVETIKAATLQVDNITPTVAGVKGSIDGFDIGFDIPGNAYFERITITEGISVTKAVTLTALYQTDELGAIQASIVDGKAVVDTVTSTKAYISDAAITFESGMLKVTTPSMTYNMVSIDVDSWNFVDIANKRFMSPGSGANVPRGAYGILTGFATVSDTPKVGTITLTTNNGFSMQYWPTGLSSKPQPDIDLCIGVVGTDGVCDSYLTSQITKNKFGAYVVQWSQVLDEWWLKGTDDTMAYSTAGAAIAAIGKEDIYAAAYTTLGVLVIKAKSDTDFVPNGGDLSTTQSIAMYSAPVTLDLPYLHYTNFSTSSLKGVFVPDTGFLSTNYDISATGGSITRIDKEYNFCDDDYMVYARVKFPTTVAANEHIGIGIGPSAIYPYFAYAVAGYADSSFFIGMRNSESSTNLVLYTPDADIDLDEDLSIVSNNDFHDILFVVSSGSASIFIDGILKKTLPVYCDVTAPGLGTGFDSDSVLIDNNCSSGDMVISTLKVFF